MIKENQNEIEQLYHIQRHGYKFITKKEKIIDSIVIRIQFTNNLSSHYFIYFKIPNHKHKTINKKWAQHIFSN